MNRRAARLGCEPTVLKIVGEYDVERKREGTKIKYLAHYFQVEVTGQTPKLNGWQLMAAIEMQPSGENMVRCVPGQTVPESYRTTDTHCDHCKSIRFRKEVFILRHDDGHFAQVGRSCIADFLGNVSVEHILGRAEWDFALNTELKEAGDEDLRWPWRDSWWKLPSSSRPRRSASVVWAGCRGPRPPELDGASATVPFPRRASPGASAPATTVHPGT